MKTFRHLNRDIAYRDEGSGPTLVFVHGTPSSSAEFDAVMAGLRARHRCIAIDHLGFGNSDKPADGDYRLSAHTDRLRALLDHLGVEQFHLIVHDFGGIIALPIAVERWGAIKTLTVMNSWAWPLEETEPVLAKQRWILNSGLMTFLYLRLNFSARLLVKSGWGSHRPLTREKHRQYMQAFSSPAERMGTHAFLQALVDAGDPAWQIHRELADLPPKPTLLLWGAADRMISARTLERWKALFPHAQVTMLERVGHFAADEAPELVVPQLLRIIGSASDSRTGSP